MDINALINDLKTSGSSLEAIAADMLEQIAELQRWDVESISANGTVCAHTSKDGEWVRAEDVVALIGGEG